MAGWHTWKRRATSEDESDLFIEPARDIIRKSGYQGQVKFPRNESELRAVASGVVFVVAVWSLPAKLALFYRLRMLNDFATVPVFVVDNDLLSRARLFREACWAVERT